MLEIDSPIELEDRVVLIEEVEEVVVKMEDSDDWFLDNIVVTFDDDDGEELDNLEEEIVVAVNKWFGDDNADHEDVAKERKVFEKGKEEI